MTTGADLPTCTTSTGGGGGNVEENHQIGLLADRPASDATNEGDYYTATDVNGGTTYRSDGAGGWDQIAGGVVGIGDPAADHLIGLLAARPAAAAGNDGVYYTATNVNGGTTYRSNGATWVQIAAGVAVGGATNLSVGTRAATTMDVDSSTGTNATLPAANTTEAGLMTDDQFDDLTTLSDGSDADGLHTHPDLDTEPPGEPNGFVDRTDCTLSWVDGTRTLTLTGNYTIWSDGTEFDITGPESIIVTDVEGPHFVYYDGTGALAQTTTFDIDLILQYCFVAYISWDATNKEAIPGAINEQHGISMSPETHTYLHSTVGTAYDSGLALTITSIDGTGNDEDNARFSSAAGVMRDEDLIHTITAHGSTDNIPVLYKDGAGGDWRMDDDAEFPVLKGTNRAYWNEFTGGAWQLTEVAQGNFVLAHIYSVPGVTPTTGYLATIMGQAEYGTANDAREGALTELLDLDLAGLPSPEFLPIGTIIFQTSTTFGNTVASKTITTDAGDDYIDWRNANVSGGGGSAVSVAWGDVTGTLSNQTDLQAELDALEVVTQLAANSTNVDFNDVALLQVGPVEERVNTVAATGATETLDTAEYGFHDITMDEACTFTFSNPAASGEASSFTMILRGAFTPTFPASVDWADASAPTYTTPTVFVFTTVDNGTTWLGSSPGKAFG